MATITRSLSSKVNGNGESEIMLRLSVSRELRLRLRSGVFMEPSGSLRAHNASQSSGIV